MQININAVGAINNANIELGSLSVIAGENDTGKSTIGKILFSLVKGISRYREDLEEDKDERILALAEYVYFTSRRVINISKNVELRTILQPRRFTESVRTHQEAAVQERIEYLSVLRDSGQMPETLYNICMSKLEEMISIISEPDDEASAMNRAVRKAFYSEFKGEIVQKGKEIPAVASINIFDGESELIDIKWAKDGICDFKYYDDLGYYDVTYVDSTSVLQFHEMISYAKTLFNSTSKSNWNTVPLHVKDLATKLQDSYYNHNMFSIFSLDENARSSLSKNYNGNFYYDKDKSDFVLDKGDYKISSYNVASGIRSLGMLDILIHSGHADQNSLLILDEPEINLHPKWQIEYAKAICEMVKNGSNIIVTTHSPYMLEALKGYCDRDGVNNKFYLAKKESQYSNFVDITSDISVAIDMLSAPLYKLNEELFDDF